MKWKVRVSLFDRDTGERISKSRVEIIDTINSEIFKGDKTALEIHDKYEDYWNHLSNRTPVEVVFVESIAKMD